MYILQLTRGLSAKIDDEDVERVLGQGRWQAVLGYNTWYASTSFKIPGTRKNKKVLLHRFLMGCKEGDGLRVDHINEDGLNCQKYNLRVCSASLNALNRSTLLANNSSGEEGVYWNEQKQKWVAEIRWQGKKIYCGASTNLADLGAIRRNVKESLLNNGLIQEALKLRKLTRKPPTSK